MDDPASSFLFFFFQDTESVASITPARVIVEFLGIFFIVLLNGFFVASEFALVSVRRTRIQKLAEEGGGNGPAAVLRLLDNPTQFISAVQLGVTLASLALGWIGEPAVAEVLFPLATAIGGEGPAAYLAHGAAIVVAFTMITFLHVVIGELVPKMFALERAEKWALIAARPLELFATVFSPVLWAFNYVGRLVGKLLGLSSSLEHTTVYT